CAIPPHFDVGHILVWWVSINWESGIRNVHTSFPALDPDRQVLLPFAVPPETQSILEPTVAGQEIFEGAVEQVVLDQYERNARARSICIAHWGLTCVVCGFNFERHYGPASAGYIHVHH